MCRGIARDSSQNTYFHCANALWEMPSNGSPQVIDASLEWLNSMSLSETYLYFQDTQGVLGRRPLGSGTLPVEVLLDGLMDSTVRYSKPLNAVFFLEYGSKEGLYFDGTLRVLTHIE